MGNCAKRGLLEPIRSAKPVIVFSGSEATQTRQGEPSTMSDRPKSDPLQLPSFRHLRVFEAVARCNNLSRAAAETHMSQPAVTQAVMKIEAWTGFKLLIRNQTRSLLTEEGPKFL